MSKPTLIFLFILIIPVHMYGQQYSLRDVQALIQAASYDEAIQKLQEINRSTPSAEGFRLLVKAYADFAWAEKTNGRDASSLQKQAMTTGHEAIKRYPESALAYLAMGYAYHYNEQYVQAQGAYEKAVALDDNYALAYFLLWTVSNIPLQEKVNSPMIQKALKLDPGLAEAWEKLGDFHKQLGNFEEALTHYQKALDIHPHHVLHYAMGSIYLQTGNAAQARTHYEQVIKLLPDFAWGHYGLGAACLLEGNFEQAANELNLAIGLNPAAWEYYQVLLENYPQLADFKIKKPGNKELKESSEAFHPSEKEDYNEAVKLAQEGYYADAANLFYDFLQDELENDDPNYGYIISAKNWTMHCLFMLGKYADAIQVAESNYIDTRDYGLPQDMASLMATIGAIYSEWGDHYYAIRFTEHSIELLNELDLTDNLAIAYSNLCDIYREAGNYPLSIEAGEEAVKRCIQAGNDELLAQNYNNLARAWLLYGDFGQAEAMITRGKTLVEGFSDGKWKSELWLTYAELLNARGKHSEALNWYLQAKEQLDLFKSPTHPYYQRILRTGAFIYINLDNPQKAGEIFTQFFELSVLFIRDYFPAMSEAGKTIFYRSLAEDYEVFNNFVLRFAHRFPELTATMYNNQLQIKGLLLNTNKKIREQVLNSGDEKLNETFKEWQDMRNLLAKQYIGGNADPDLIHRLSLRIDGLETVLSQSSTLFDKAERKDKGQWKDVRAQLAEEESTVEMVRFRSFDFRLYKAFGKNVQYAALVITPQTHQPKLIHYENGTEMEGRYFKGYSNAIQFTTTDRDSYNVYWKPLAQALEGSSTVYFSAEGVFHKINLEGLFDTDLRAYLADTKSIRLLTGPGDLLKEKKAGPLRKEAVLLGYPDYKLAGIPGTPTGSASPLDFLKTDNQTGLSRSGFGAIAELPGTLKEVERIEKTLHSDGWKVTKYMGAGAREEKLKSVDSPALLHIATHGYFEQTDTLVHPLLSSGLLLAGAAKAGGQATGDVEDGVLTAYEAMNLRLDHTELVVLSACETGRGVAENNEGVYGLQSALLFAGARNVIMSLWKVDDQATQELMALFYAHYVEMKNPYPAFKAAQQKLREKFKEPYFWAAFVMVGR